MATTGTGGTSSPSSCTGLPANAVYYGSGTSYTPTGTLSGGLTATYTTGAILANTCQYACTTGYSYMNGSCLTLDPYAANVVTLLHFDNGLVDDTGKTWTAVNGTTTSTTQKYFGAGSLLTVAASNQYITVPGSTDFEFGSGNFTIDTWVYFNTA